MGSEVPSHPGAGLQHAWLRKANAITPKVPLPPPSTSCYCWAQCHLGWDGPSVSEVSCPAVPPPLPAGGQVRGSTVLVLGKCCSAGTDTALHYQLCIGHKSQTQPLTSHCEKKINSTPAKASTMCHHGHTSLLPVLPKAPTTVYNR